MLKKQVILRDVADYTLQAPDVPVKVQPVDAHAAAIGGELPGKDIQQRGFARTALSHDPHQPAARLAKAEVMQTIIASPIAEFKILPAKQERLMGGALKGRVDLLIINAVAVDIPQNTSRLQEVRRAGRQRQGVGGKLFLICPEKISINVLKMIN